MDEAIAGLIDLVESAGYDLKAEDIYEVFNDAGLAIISADELADIQHGQ